MNVKLLFLTLAIANICGAMQPNNPASARKNIIKKAEIQKNKKIKQEKDNLSFINNEIIFSKGATINFEIEAFCQNELRGSINGYASKDGNAIELFSVGEKFRNQGIGTRLFCVALEFIKSKFPDQVVSWQVRSDDPEVSNEELIKKYEHMIAHAQKTIPGRYAIIHENNFLSAIYMEYYFA